MSDHFSSQDRLQIEEIGKLLSVENMTLFEDEQAPEQEIIAEKIEMIDKFMDHEDWTLAKIGVVDDPMDNSNKKFGACLLLAYTANV